MTHFNLFYYSILEYSDLLQKQHKLKKQIFSIEVVKSIAEPGNGSVIIEVSGFSSAVSEDMLEMYFESKKSGGREDAIKKCVIVREGIAHLTFKDSEGTILHTHNFMYTSVIKFIVGIK